MKEEIEEFEDEASEPRFSVSQEQKIRRAFPVQFSQAEWEKVLAEITEAVAVYEANLEFERRRLKPGEVRKRFGRAASLVRDAAKRVSGFGRRLAYDTDANAGEHTDTNERINNLLAELAWVRGLFLSAEAQYATMTKPRKYAEKTFVYVLAAIATNAIGTFPTHKIHHELCRCVLHAVHQTRPRPGLQDVCKDELVEFKRATSVES